jgi:hypothetical protein
MRQTFASFIAVGVLATVGCVDEPDDTIVGTEAIGETNENDAEAPYATGCSASQVLVSPIAKQCCYGQTTKFSPFKTMFILPDNRVSTRNHNDAGNAGCKAADGVSSCSGANCTYGPAGFSSPIRFSPPDPLYPYPKVFTVTRIIDHGTGWINVCDYTWHASPQTSSLPNVTGSFGRACGCSCNGNGAKCLDTGSEAYANGGTCPQASVTCASTGCPTGGGGGADLFAY